MHLEKRKGKGTFQITIKDRANGDEKKFIFLGEREEKKGIADLMYPGITNISLSLQLHLT